MRRDHAGRRASPARAGDGRDDRDRRRPTRTRATGWRASGRGPRWPTPSDEAADTVHAPSGPAESADARDYALTTQVTLAALRATAGRAVQPARRRAGGRRRTGARGRGPVRHRQDHGHPVAGRTTGLRLRRDRLDHPGRRGAPAREAALAWSPTPSTRDGRSSCSPDDLGLAPTPGSGRLARFVVLRRGVPDPRGLVRLEPMEALLNLIEQSSSVSQAADPLVTLLSLVRSDWRGVGAGVRRDQRAPRRARGPAWPATSRPRPLPEPAAPPRYATGAGERRPARTRSDGCPGWTRSSSTTRSSCCTATRAVRLDHLMATIWLELDLTAHPRRARRRRPGVGTASTPTRGDLVEKAVDLLVE